MAEVELIRRVADDVAALKEQMSRIEITINEEFKNRKALNSKVLRNLMLIFQNDFNMVEFLDFGHHDEIYL